ncbi:MAG: hypothetical protein U9N39_09065 [Campylobacterota bacterium]|nr:hypothetical protein [Campylobacterota bacterium]
MRLLFTSLVLLTLFFVGCNSQPAPAKTSAEPTWILNPMQNGNVGAVGVAGRTYDQKPSTQRKLAITRALDELTLQQGVKVNLNMSKRDVVVNETASLSMDTQSNYSASSTLTAHIESIYKDSYSGELYVWLVMD